MRPQTESIFPAYRTSRPATTLNNLAPAHAIETPTWAGDVEKGNAMDYVTKCAFNACGIFTVEQWIAMINRAKKWHAVQGVTANELYEGMLAEAADTLIEYITEEVIEVVKHAAKQQGFKLHGARR